MIHLIDLHFLGFDRSIASFLYETSDGPILIETGPHSTYDKLKEGVARAGFRMEDIKHVFLTHIHLDHAGAAWAMAEKGATIYVHPFGAPHLHRPEKLMNSARRIYKDKMDALWGSMEGIAENRIREAGSEESFRVGDTFIKAWYTPGHAVHHIA
ncbi:MAG: MBL fold metallo-hydrolase, partial [Saprospiraceae bacterium]|nr:MBL fold metallo-hydrolase [Saprospiraceae bacterium]